jgi:hypothetical protein
MSFVSHLSQPCLWQSMTVRRYGRLPRSRRQRKQCVPVAVGAAAEEAERAARFRALHPEFVARPGVEADVADAGAAYWRRSVNRPVMRSGKPAT